MLLIVAHAISETPSSSSVTTGSIHSSIVDLAQTSGRSIHRKRPRSHHFHQPGPITKMGGLCFITLQGGDQQLKTSRAQFVTGKGRDTLADQLIVFASHNTGVNVIAFEFRAVSAASRGGDGNKSE